MFSVRAVSVLFFAMLLVGCAKEAPKCSDPETLSAVRGIIVGQFGTENPAAKLSKKDRDEKIQIQNPRAESFDEKIKKYSCEANLLIAFRPSGESLQMPIKYESQLDDSKEHLVFIKNVMQRDMFILAVAFNTEAASDAERQKAGSVPAVVQSAAPATQQTAPPTPTPVTPDQKATVDTVEKSGICKSLDLAVTADMRECISKKYAIADGELNDVYKQVMARLDEVGKSTLRTQQRQWVKDKEAKCTAAGKEHEGGTMQSVVVGDCQVQMTEKQVAFLKAYK